MTIHTEKETHTHAHTQTNTGAIINSISVTLSLASVTNFSAFLNLAFVFIVNADRHETASKHISAPVRHRNMFIHVKRAIWLNVKINVVQPRNWDERISKTRNALGLTEDAKLIINYLSFTDSITKIVIDRCPGIPCGMFKWEYAIDRKLYL